MMVKSSSRGRGLDLKPPLPSVNQNMTLNLSKIPPPRAMGHLSNSGGHLGGSTGHLGLGSPALGKMGSSRKVTGSVGKAKIHQDFELLASFWRRERDFAQTVGSKCKYPWLEVLFQASFKLDPQPEEQPTPNLRPTAGFDDWKAKMNMKLDDRCPPARLMLPARPSSQSSASRK